MNRKDEALFFSLNLINVLLGLFTDASVTQFTNVGTMLL